MDQERTVAAAAMNNREETNFLSSIIDQVAQFLGSGSGVFITSMNIVLMILSALVAVIYGAKCFSEKIEKNVKMIIIGVVMTATGLFSHGAFWVANKGLFIDGDDGTKNVLPPSSYLIGGVAESIQNDLGILVIASAVLILVGYLFHLSPYLMNLLGSDWLIKALTIIATIFGVSSLLQYAVYYYYYNSITPF